MGGGGGAGGEGGVIGGSLGVAGATAADVYKKRKSHDLLPNAQVYII
jgi:hypothetical protein